MNATLLSADVINEAAFFISDYNLRKSLNRASKELVSYNAMLALFVTDRVIMSGLISAYLSLHMHCFLTIFVMLAIQYVQLRWPDLVSFERTAKVWQAFAPLYSKVFFMRRKVKTSIYS